MQKYRLEFTKTEWVHKIQVQGQKLIVLEGLSKQRLSLCCSGCIVSVVKAEMII